MVIRINTHGNPLPGNYGDGDWTDLAASEDCEIGPMEYKEIPLGVSMELPEGAYAIVVPRSSTFRNHRIIMTNSMGVIDNSYRGDGDIWKFPALNTGDHTTAVRKGERIAQFRVFAKGEKIIFEKTESLGNKNRGGIGSTGR